MINIWLIILMDCITKNILASYSLISHGTFSKFYEDHHMCIL